MLATTMRRAAQQGRRRLLSDGLTAEGKIKSLPMVYIKGEEMTRYAAQLMLENWLEPHVDTSAWEFFDLSCAARDASNDQTLKDAVPRARRSAPSSRSRPSRRRRSRSRSSVSRNPYRRRTAR